MDQKKYRLILIISIILLFCIIISLFVYFIFFLEDESKENGLSLDFQVDNKISPYTNQGLMIEILRIRNRDLLDKMLIRYGPGRDWKNPPSFYYKTYVDGKEGNSKGNIGEFGVYSKWDNFGEESCISYYIWEENLTSDITIMIIEEEKTGLFKSKTNEVEKERIDLEYDFRTGRWTGDDFLMDRDGYGHYRGDTYEIWFNIYQSDYDHDGIPYWTEVNVLKSDPTIDDRKKDPDNDSIPTSWEWRWGYDPYTWDDHRNLDPDVDGIENIEEYKIRRWFADPFQPDIYIETDGMQKRGLFDVKHIFWKEAQQMIIELFAQHGINVYIDDGWKDGPVNGGGEMLPFYYDLDDVVGKQGLSFYLHNFADARKGIFRYVVVGNKAGFIHPSEYNMMDTIIVGSNYKSYIFTRRAFSPRHIRVGNAKNILHELGHSLGLLPITFPGNDIRPRRDGDRYPSMDEEEYNRYLKEYHSIMNYYYIHNDRTLFDYSDGSNGEPYDQNDWDFIYLPTFQIDQIMYEEPTDFDFEDFEIVNDYPGVILDNWDYSDNLTIRYEDDFKDLAIVKNAHVNIQIYKKNESLNKNEINIKIFAMPKVYPTHAVWSLIAEGKVDSEDNIEIYSQQKIIDSLINQ